LNKSFLMREDLGKAGPAAAGIPLCLRTVGALLPRHPLCEPCLRIKNGNNSAGGVIK